MIFFAVFALLSLVPVILGNVQVYKYLPDSSFIPSLFLLLIYPKIPLLFIKLLI